jgi:hypothetical protein
MLRRCDQGHLTGFRHCWCGSEKVYSFDWLNAVLEPAPLREAKVRRPHKRTVGISVPGWSMFREWRERAKAKRAARKPSVAARF